MRRKTSILAGTVLFFLLTLILAGLTGCGKEDPVIMYQTGTFPDTVLNLAELNSVYNDYNTSSIQIEDYAILIFSTNRKSAGGQYDLEQGLIQYIFDKTTGAFGLAIQISYDEFVEKLIAKAETPKNDLGPYRFYSALDGYEYTVLSSENNSGNLDIKYLRNRPAYAGIAPDIEGPFLAKRLNTDFDEGYLCCDVNLDSVYFTNNSTGNFDIYMQVRPADKDFQSWFNQDYSVSERVDSINSSYDDKCPILQKNIMVFTSNRPGGFGGYDLYYSIFRKGKWSSPVNMGARINTASDEYRTIIGYNSEFTNHFLIFSSNRPGGLGGYDLYFSGYNFPKK